MNFQQSQGKKQEDEKNNNRNEKRKEGSNGSTPQDTKNK